MQTGKQVRAQIGIQTIARQEWIIEDADMYYVEDGCIRCGYYECEDCGTRFLSEKIVPTMACPYCGEEPDMELGPDDEMPQNAEAAKLLEVIEGAEEVEKMDALLSLAVTGGDYTWI